MKLASDRQVASIDALPSYEWKTQLQRAIQVLKRHRDVMFRDQDDLKPVSVLITTLAALAYAGEEDLFQALSGILARMPGLVRAHHPKVPNPLNPMEDFADRWKNDRRLALMGNEHHGTWASGWNLGVADPGHDSKLPAVGITWDEIDGPDGFLERLNLITARAKPDGQAFRLPSETEWEYGCRAGTTTKWHFGDDPTGLDAHAWHKGNSDGMVHPVGLLPSNPWGLHDLYGNVYERCSDIYVAGHEWKPRDGRPMLKGDPRLQSVRGGSCGNGPMGCRSASRYFYHTDSFFTNVGFRVVLAHPHPKRPIPPAGT